jgi:hypothetical protein
MNDASRALSASYVSDMKTKSHKDDHANDILSVVIDYFNASKPFDSQLKNTIKREITVRSNNKYSYGNHSFSLHDRIFICNRTMLKSQ